MKTKAGDIYTVYNQYLKRYTACKVAYIAPPDTVRWRGQNLLGFALMEVRDELRRVTQNEMLCDWSTVWQK